MRAHSAATAVLSVMVAVGVRSLPRELGGAFASCQNRFGIDSRWLVRAGPSAVLVLMRAPARPRPARRPSDWCSR
jgi:hypothetical protein